MKKITPSEFNECLCLIEYLTIKNIKFSHIANEGGMKLPWGVIRKRTALGCKRGLPDYIICLPKILLFLEMKRENGGKVSPEQQEWIDELNKYINVKAEVAKGFDEAKKIIDKYL